MGVRVCGCAGVLGVYFRLQLGVCVGPVGVGGLRSFSRASPPPTDCMRKSLAHSFVLPLNRCL